MRIQSILAAVVVLLIVIVVALIPFADGYFFKENYLKLLSSISADKRVTIKVLNYHLGWFSSTAKIEVDQTLELAVAAKTPGAPAATTVSFILDQKISHGPFLFDLIENRWELARAEISSDITLPIMMKPVFVNNQPSKSDVHIDTIVTLSGDYNSQIYTSSFALMPLPGVPQMTWKGMHGITDFQISNNQIMQSNGEYTISGFSAQNEMGNIQLGDMQYHFQVKRNSLGLWDGTSAFAVSSFALSSTQGFYFKFDGLKASVQANVEAPSFYNISEQLDLNHLNSADFAITPSSMKFAFNHLSTEGYKEFMQEVSKTTGFDSKALPGLFIKLVTPSSTLNPVLNLHTSSGNVMLTGQFYLPPNVVFSSVEQLFNNLNLKMNLRISQTLVNKLIDMKYPNTQPAETQVDPSVKSDQTILAQIDAWTKQGQIPLDISLQLKDLVHHHLKSPDFSRNMDQYVIRKEVPSAVAEQMKADYALAHPVTVAPPQVIPPMAPAVVAPQPVAPSVPAPAPMTPGAQLKLVIGQWVQQGYLTLDQGDYVTEITREQGVVKLNGKPAPAELSIPMQ